MVVLSPVEYKILKYIEKHPLVTIDQLKNEFGDKIAAIDERISKLADEQKLIYQTFETEISPTGRPLTKYKDNYDLTETGIIALQDYKAQKKHDFLMLCLSKWIIPMFVSIGTTLILQAIGLLIWYIKLR